MRVAKTSVKAALIAFVLVPLIMWSVAACAAVDRVDCNLADTAYQLGSENHALSVLFDENAKTLKALDGSQTYNFDDVSISNIAISGNVDSVSIGIDRSSLGVVWQQYKANGIVTEFGHCRRTGTGG